VQHVLESSPEYNSSTVLEILHDERDRAIITSGRARQVWRLVGSSGEKSEFQQLIDYFANSQGHELRRLPMLSIHGSPAVDAEGVFRTKVNMVFEFLLNSDIFTIDEKIQKKTFAEFSGLGYQSRRKRYFVFGLVFYWCIIIYRQIPFPESLNPAIFAYGIYGYLPTTVIHQVNPEIAEIVETVEQYTPRMSIDAVDENVKSFLNHHSFDFGEFISDLRHSQHGPQLLARTIGTTTVIGNCMTGFTYFREGFTSNRGFTSVYLFIFDTNELSTST
jgi:hypothetical protein